MNEYIMNIMLRDLTDTVNHNAKLSTALWKKQRRINRMAGLMFFVTGAELLHILNRLDEIAPKVENVENTKGD